MINIGIIGCGWIAEKSISSDHTKINDVDAYAVFEIVEFRLEGGNHMYLDLCASTA
jgi:predicted dehydrogenase